MIIVIVMLLTREDDNTIGSFWLCLLFYMLSVIYMYKSAFIYNYGM